MQVRKCKKAAKKQSRTPWKLVLQMFCLFWDMFTRDILKVPVFSSTAFLNDKQSTVAPKKCFYEEHNASKAGKKLLPCPWCLLSVCFYTFNVFVQKNFQNTELWMYRKRRFSSKASNLINIKESSLYSKFWFIQCLWTLKPFFLINCSPFLPFLNSNFSKKKNLTMSLMSSFSLLLHFHCLCAKEVSKHSTLNVLPKNVLAARHLNG